MTAHSLPDLAAAWLTLWNGDLGRLDRITAEDFVMHAILPGTTRLQDLRGRQPLADWIRQTHELFSERTTYELEPIIADPFIVVRWHSTGSYRGGMPDVPSDAVGRSIDFKGIDILRVEKGLVAEFWISADTTVLMDQLGAATE